MRMWRIALLALAGLRRNPLRVGLTALGVTIASGALVSMVGFALGIQQQAETPFKTLGLINVIRVSPKHTKTKDPNSKANSPVLDDAVLKRIEALDGVEVAYPDFRVRGLKVSHGDKHATVLALGLPRQVPMIEAAGEMMLAGEYFSLTATPEALIAKVLAADLGFPSPADAVGATLALEASGLAPNDAATFALKHKNLAVTIVGVYATPPMMPRRVARTLLLPVDVMQEIPDARLEPAVDSLKAGRDATAATYKRVTVRVRHHTDLVPAQKAIEAMGYRTRTLLSRLEAMRTFFLFMDVLLAAIGTVALVVAGLGIINTLLISVLERTQEIGICKAIGASDGDLMVLFLTEAGIIGTLGGIGGLVLGRGVSWLLELGINAYARTHDITVHLTLFAFPAWLVAATVAFALVVSVLAGVYPAFRAARVDPIKALRHD